MEGYAAADIERLKSLLSSEVLKAFAQSCTDRAQQAVTVELTLIAMDSVDVVDVDVNTEAMEVTLRFRAQMIWTERGADGVPIGNDPFCVAETVETWTFARPVPVTGDAWILVGTGA